MNKNNQLLVITLLLFILSIIQSKYLGFNTYGGPNYLATFLLIVLFYLLWQKNIPLLHAGDQHYFDKHWRVRGG